MIYKILHNHLGVHYCLSTPVIFNPWCNFNSRCEKGQKELYLHFKSSSRINVR